MHRQGYKSSFTEGAGKSTTVLEETPASQEKIKENYVPQIKNWPSRGASHIAVLHYVIKELSRIMEVPVSVKQEGRWSLLHAKNPYNFLSL